MSIADLRREYNLTGLRRRDLEADAIAQFKKWFEQAAGWRRGGRLRRFFVRLYLVLFGLSACLINRLGINDDTNDYRTNSA